MTTDTQQYYGQTDPSTTQGEYNRLRFAVQQQMMALNTSMPVRVLSVQAAGLDPVGLVSVQILVDQVDGEDKTVPHGEIPNVPYFRLQGGSDAVIIDPKIGDIGMASFCSRDISAVKAARKEAPPGSRRAYDFSDAMYFGGFLNGTPTQYVQFTEGGILVHSAGGVSLGNTTGELQRLVDERFVTLFNGHTHGGSAAPDQSIGAGELTSLVRAN